MHRRRDLYALPPEEFTAARNALAKELKAAGDKDARRGGRQAAAAERRRPRPEPGRARAAGADRGRPRRRHRAAGGERGRRARATPAGSATPPAPSGPPPRRSPRPPSRTSARAATRWCPALLATLRAGALDEDVAEQLRTGTLSTEHEQAGFGFGLEAGDGAVAPRRATKAPAEEGGCPPEAAGRPRPARARAPRTVAHGEGRAGRGPRRRAPAQEGPRLGREERRPPRARGRRAWPRRPTRPKPTPAPPVRPPTPWPSAAADAPATRLAGLGGRVARPVASSCHNQNERAPARSQT